MTLLAHVLGLAVLAVVVVWQAPVLMKVRDKVAALVAKKK